MRAKMQQASQERDEAQAACTRWVRQAPLGCCVIAAQMMGRAAWTAGRQRSKISSILSHEFLHSLPTPFPPCFCPCSAELAVQAAQNELAGAEAGDGRDASNRSLQERLADAQNAQVG